MEFMLTLETLIGGNKFGSFNISEKNVNEQFYKMFVRSSGAFSEFL